jgi:hypothetical protein
MVHPTRGAADPGAVRQARRCVWPQSWGAFTLLGTHIMMSAQIDASNKAITASRLGKNLINALAQRLKSLKKSEQMVE